ncbi:MAG: Glycine oxidase ThiO, partial [uncultured Gemmatimonadetes bacterium]
ERREHRRRGDRRRGSDRVRHRPPRGSRRAFRRRGGARHPRDGGVVGRRGNAFPAGRGERAGALPGPAGACPRDLSRLRRRAARGDGRGRELRGRGHALGCPAGGGRRGAPRAVAVAVRGGPARRTVVRGAGAGSGAGPFVRRADGASLSRRPPGGQPRAGPGAVVRGGTGGRRIPAGRPGGAAASGGRPGRGGGTGGGRAHPRGRSRPGGRRLGGDDGGASPARPGAAGARAAPGAGGGTPPVPPRGGLAALLSRPPRNGAGDRGSDGGEHRLSQGGDALGRAPADRRRGGDR